MNFYDEGMKITWGQPFGWMNNSADAAAPACLKGGWGQYSLSIVMDSKAGGGVMRIRDENRGIHGGKVAFTAATGTVKVKGPVGTVNIALQTLSPAGYDHNYRAWWVAASGNQADVSLDISDAAVSLVAPVLRISDMAAAPSVLTLNGGALTVGKDYYASYDAAGKEAWITLAKTLKGNNRITAAAGPQAIRGGRDGRAGRGAGGSGLSGNGEAGFGWFALDGSRAAPWRPSARVYFGWSPNSRTSGEISVLNK